MTEGQRVQIFLEQVTGWAADQADVLAVGLVGSYARGQAGATSDIDLILIASDPGRLLEQRSWIEAFGPLQKVQVEEYGKVTSLRVWYRDGLEVEFGLTSREWAKRPLDAGTRQVIEDGLQVLSERENLLDQLL